MKMNKQVLIIKNIEELYEELFSRKGMGVFMRSAWYNIKDDYIKKPAFSEICFRLMIEELTVFYSAIKGEEGYNNILNLLKKEKQKLKMKSYNEFYEYYEDYIEPLRDYLKKNPDRRKKIFDIDS